MAEQFPSFLSPQDFLAESPETTFFSFQNQFGRSPNQRRFFQGQFRNVFNQYLGNLGQQLQQGKQPDANFSNFLGDFNFSGQFGRLPPSIRGATTQRFAPQTRFLSPNL
jgi:hypothetical protein